MQLAGGMLKCMLPRPLAGTYPFVCFVLNLEIVLNHWRHVNSTLDVNFVAVWKSINDHIASKVFGLMKSVTHKIRPEPGHSSKIECAPGKDSVPIRVFAGSSVDSQGFKASSGGQRRFWSDCASAQSDLNLRWSHLQSISKCCAPTNLWVANEEYHADSLKLNVP